MLRSCRRNGMDDADNGCVNGPPLWTHPDPSRTRIWEFKTHIEQKYGESFPEYEALRQWSIKNLDFFWSEVWHFTGVVASEPFTEVWAPPVLERHECLTQICIAVGRCQRRSYVPASNFL